MFYFNSGFGCSTNIRIHLITKSTLPQIFLSAFFMSLSSQQSVPEQVSKEGATSLAFLIKNDSLVVLFEAKQT